MAIRERLLARYWLKPRGEYDVSTGTTQAEQSRPLRAIFWRDEGRQDQRTGEIIGQRDRWPRIALLALGGHWLRHWTHYTGCATAIFCAAIGSDAFKSYLEHQRVKYEPAEQHQDCPAAPSLFLLDRNKDCPVAPLRCE